LKACCNGLTKLVYKLIILVARALEVIPRILSQNCGAEAVRVVTDLRARHADKTDPNHVNYGINGHTGVVSNMKDLNILDTLSVKKQTLKTSVEVSFIL
jgi:T-complex protein 1 subunit gamma